jgi:hypothetical protein
MKTVSLAVIVLIGTATAALACFAQKNENDENVRHYAEIDTVGDCSVVDSKPSASAGMTILGDQSGYATKEEATEAEKALPKGKCKGFVG